MDTRTLQRQIHVGCKQLGLDDDTRHDLQLVTTGKDSMTNMSVADLKKVLEALQRRGFKPGFKGKSKGRYAPAPRADLRKIHVLWRLLGDAGKLTKPGRVGLNTFLRARFEKKWGAVPIDVDTLQDAGQINDVIRALLDWCQRERVALK